MANILRTKDGKIIDYLISVNTPEYLHPDNLVNPVLPNAPLKFLKRVGDLVEEMTQAEKDVVLQSETQTLETSKDTQADGFQIEALTLAKALVKAGLITKPALITAIKQVD